MKNLKNLILFAIVLAMALFSCKKEYNIEPEQQTTVKAVLRINSGPGLKAQGDTLIKNGVTTVDGTASTGPIKSFAMTFGDGGGTGIVNVGTNDSIYSTHAWTAVGQYNVALTVYSGPDGTGVYNSDSKTVWIVDSITPPPPPPPAGNDILILLDSTNLGNGQWLCNFKLNVDVAFFAGCTGPFHYKGDDNYWGLTQINGNQIDEWFYFDVYTDQWGERFTVIILQGGNNELWARTTPDVNQNETSISKWNVYGCFEVIGLSNAIVPAYTPGIRGDQQISLEPGPGANQTKVFVKDLNFRVPGQTPGFQDKQQPGWMTPMSLIPDPHDPYGRWSYVIVQHPNYYWSGNAYQGMCFFKLLPDVGNPSVHHIWPSSYFIWPNGNAPEYYGFQTTIL